MYKECQQVTEYQQKIQYPYGSTNCIRFNGSNLSP